MKIEYRESEIDVEVDYHVEYKKGSDPRMFKIVLSKDPYKSFEMGDKVYHSSSTEGFHEVRGDAYKLNDNHHFLVVSSEEVFTLKEVVEKNLVKPVEAYVYESEITVLKERIEFYKLQEIKKDKELEWMEEKMGGSFTRGYTCACATLAEMEGDATASVVCQLLRCSTHDIEGLKKAGVDEVDIQRLLPAIEELKRKKAIIK